MALRQEHGLFDTTMRMAELTTLLLEAPPTSTVREVLGEAIEELPGLLYWSQYSRSHGQVQSKDSLVRSWAAGDGRAQVHRVTKEEDLTSQQPPVRVPADRG